MTRRCWNRWWAYYHETLKQSPEALEYLEIARADESGD